MPICKLGDPQQKWRQLQTAAFPENLHAAVMKYSKGLAMMVTVPLSQKKQQGLDTQSC